MLLLQQHAHCVFNNDKSKIVAVEVRYLSYPVNKLPTGVAYRNNRVTQRRIADEGGIPILVQILLNPPSEEVQVEVAISLACVVLSNRENQEKLQEEPNFKFDILLDLLRSRNEVRDWRGVQRRNPKRDDRFVGQLTE